MKINRQSITSQNRQALVAKNESEPFNIKDRVEIGNNKEDEIGIAHKSLRALGKLAGGTVGAAAGTAIGGVTEPLTSITTYSLPNIAIFGALTGTVTGLVAGGAIVGAAGCLPGTLIGVPVGAALSLAFFRSGLLFGLYSAVKGGAKGAYKGAQIGAQAGGKLVDKSFELGTNVAGLFKSKSAQATA
jgi:hypothetical protein